MTGNTAGIAVSRPTVRVSSNHQITQEIDLVEPGDVTVIIDVIRAFTTACVLFHRGATEIVCARDWAEADRVHPDAVMVGEIESGPLPPGVLRNSPVDADRWDLPDSRVSLFTLNGTRVLAAAPRGGLLMAAAAVNASATAAWILARSVQRVHVVVSDPAAVEDHSCATYLASLLTNVPVDRARTSREISAGRYAHWNRWGAAVSTDRWRAFEADVEVCARLDVYPIAMIADRSCGPQPVLRPSPVEQVR